jgi:hypothetical protein
MAAPKNMTPAQRVLRAKIAAHTSWAGTANRAERTAAARQAAHDRFEKQVDPDGALPPDVRRQRAASARNAHIHKMAAASAKARRLKAGARPSTTAAAG